jgi:hypothetical protein
LSGDSENSTSEADCPGNRHLTSDGFDDGDLAAQNVTGMVTWESTAMSFADGVDHKTELAELVDVATPARRLDVEN